MRIVRSLQTALLLILLHGTHAAAQRPLLTPADYAQWESIGSAELSPDGRWAAWTLSRVDGDGDLRIRAVAGDSTIIVPYGARPAFSANGRWLAYRIGVSTAERERREKAGESVRGGVGVLDLRSLTTTIIRDIADFEFSGDGAFIALHGYAPRGSTSRGHDLIVRDLDRAIDMAFANIAESAWQPHGAVLAMIVDAPSRTGNGVRTWDAHTGILRTLESDSATFTGLAWRDGGSDIAALRRSSDGSPEKQEHGVIAWHDVTGTVRRAELDPATNATFPAHIRIVDARPLRWSEDGSTIFVGTRPRSATDPDTAAADEPDADSAAAAPQEEPGVEVWHAADVEIVPERKVRERFDASRSRVAAWRPRDGTFVQLADSTLPEVTLSDGRFAIGLDPSPWERERMFGPLYRDLYAVDVMTGERTRVAERVQFHYGVSPGGRYVLYVRDGDYWTYDTQTGRTTNITANVPATFINLENDHTIEEKPPFGTGGWTKGDSTVLLYDRYDIWEVRPDGAGGVNLTNGAAERIRHRRVWLTTSDNVVDRSRPVYVALYGDRTKRSGWSRIMPDGRHERLLLIDANVSRLARADSADVYMYRVESFDDSPDLFVTGSEFRARQISNTNPFQDDYAWGRAELIDYTNESGDDLQAALFYPADYEPGRSYPMIVYIYEITSPTLHTYTPPSEFTPYNPTVFTQNGYFVLRPDIVYRGRDPGLSAVEALVPAVETVLERGDVDRDRIGLLGHSWGGYQTAFAVTQTDLFRAAVAGAPLTNLISMYLSIYWNTGGTDARIFEIDQGRMEVPFWEDLDAYMRNSPLFNIQALDTPLLVTFGDQDGAVDWHQGIELYNAARRAGKDMVLLVYDGENHSLSKKPNQLDYHRRIREWFGHYLKGEPAPDWMLAAAHGPG